MPDRFEDLRTFVTVVDAGGFVAAAGRLNLVKSAVSRRVRDLENRLGARLLNRTTRRLHLTDAGQDFYDRSVRLLAELGEAEDAAGAQSGELRGRIRVAAPVSFTSHCLAPVIGRFAAAHPRVTVEIDTDDRLVDIVRDGYDVALRISRLRDSTLVARRIATVRHVCCASPDLLERFGRPEAPEDLAAMPGVYYSNVEQARYWAFAGGRSPDVHSQVCFSNGDAVREAAVAGVGVAMLPTFIAHDAIRRGDLEILLRDHLRAPIAMYAVHPSARNLPARTRAFIDFMVETFGDAPFWDEGLFPAGDLGRAD